MTFQDLQSVCVKQNQIYTKSQLGLHGAPKVTKCYKGHQTSQKYN